MANFFDVHANDKLPTTPLKLSGIVYALKYRNIDDFCQFDKIPIFFLLISISPSIL